MNNLVNIYNTFKPNNNKYKERETLSSIIKGTKSVLASKLKFKQYIQSYSKKTERSSFKSPGISEYPIFKKQSSLLIPVKIRKINFYEDLNVKSEKNDEDFLNNKKKLFLISPSPRDSTYKNKFLKAIRTSKDLFRNKLFKTKKITKKERYNSLFLDFFYKWTNNSLNNSKVEFSDNNKNIEEIKNDKYSELKYDDNKIFNQDYNKFIKEKIEYIKKNKINNNQEKIENTFNDVNRKEIHLKLESIKIIFKPIKNKKNKNIIKSYNIKNEKEKENREIILYIPLYYAFLIYYKKLELFKKILVSSIIFSENFDKIEFNDTLISSTLKDYTNYYKGSDNSPSINKRKETNYDSKKNIRPTNSNLQLTLKKNQPFRKLATKNYMNYPGSFGEKKSNNGSIFNMLKNSFLENNINKKKEEIIHSNKNKKRKSICNINYLSGKNSIGEYENYNDEKKNDENLNINSNNFNEYIFLWETPSKTFLVTILMPIIYFKYKDLKNEISAFCEKNLFLYIYKNNFINWDFYALNFLFSIKAFRKIILSNYSLVKKKIFKDIIFCKTINTEKSLNSINNFLSFRNKQKKMINIKEQNKNILYDIDNKIYEFSNEALIINKNKNKIYNALNENNESYLFFYTDDLCTNSIIKLYSYLIVIDYEKLNPKLTWKYYLDFKQMKQLNEISKYESLDTFLPKLIKTDFQNGLLSMDFSLFEEFDIDILGYEKKNIMNENKIKNKTINTTNMANNNISNKELCIDIQYPFVKIIKANYNNIDNNTFFTLTKVDLNINFLQIINNYNIDLWSQKILEIINMSKDKDNLNNNLYLSPSFNSNNIPKNKNMIKITPFSNPVNKDTGSNYKKFIKSITFSGIPAISKFH